MEPYVGGAKYGGQVSPSYYGCPKPTQVSPVYTKSHDPCHYPVAGAGYGRTAAFVLVLFILLVIILRTCW